MMETRIAFVDTPVRLALKPSNSYCSTPETSVASVSARTPSLSNSDEEHGVASFCWSSKDVDCAQIHNLDDLVEQNEQVLACYLREMDLNRGIVAATPDERLGNLEDSIKFKQTSLVEESNEWIPLPERMAEDYTELNVADNDELDETVREQLHEYLEEIETMYHMSGSRRSFKEASDMAMATASIMSPSLFLEQDYEDSESSFGSKDEQHKHSAAGGFDPVTKFTAFLAILVKDISDGGVHYDDQDDDEAPLFLPAYTGENGEEIAKQMSLDIAWDLLMEDSFKDLRRTIYTTSKEFKRFRHLFVHCVLATDTINNELSRHRQRRWDLSFAEEKPNEEGRRLNATVVLELLVNNCVQQHPSSCCCESCMRTMEVAFRCCDPYQMDAVRFVPMALVRVRESNWESTWLCSM